ncbi:MAG: hypothetical protein B6D46_03160 [Polyangiaceae bacterium UTPRO1]|nr:DUF1566 domain-containing protein [Myxococcales bacterium]OQY68406.1 MAG: hypothetical protein B6D46_03160 [Polyangiaceae bacterium UTPRO1]
MLFRPLTTVLALAAALGAAASIAGAAATPQQKCQAAKNKTAGQYAACRQNAEAKLATGGDTTKYAVAIGKCASKFTKAWQKASAKAAAKGATCFEAPLAADDFQTVIDAATTNVATALAGDGFTGCTDTGGTGGGLLKSGQTTSYGPGSDGDLRKGVARSYTDNGDGTITDNVTGLMWEKKSDDGSIHDKDNMYAWGTASPPYTMNGTMVTTFLAALNAGGGFAGHTDWRIPNRFELESLLDLENVNPAVNSVFNTSCTGGCTVTTCSCTQSFSYWSSTTYQNLPDLAWYVTFNFGIVNGTGKSSLNYVRAVRGGS